MTDNSNFHAGLFDINNPPPCTCHIIKDLGPSLIQTKGHHAIKGPDITKAPYDKVFNVSGCSKPISTFKTTKVSLARCLGCFVNSITKDRVDLEDIPDDTVSSICRIESSHPRCSYSEISPRDIFFQHSFPTDRLVRSLARKLVDVVISYLDKNLNSAFLCCRLLFWIYIKETFNDDSDTYKIVEGAREEYIIQRWICWFHENINLQIVLPKLSHLCIPGYANILFKNKDTLLESPFFRCTRVRQLCKFSRFGLIHPFKLLFRLVNAACFKIMQETPHLGFALKKVGDLISSIDEITSELLQIFGKNNTRFIILNYDVVNFFTNVKKPQIKEALRFFITENPLLKFRCVWINKRNFKDVHFKTKPLMEELYYKLEIEDIVKTIEFDLDNCFMLLGSFIIIHQKSGIPMGGFLSSMLSIMLANYAEHKMLSDPCCKQHFIHEASDRLIVRGLRSTDDAIIIIATNKSQTFNLTIFKDIFLHWFNNFSGNTLDLEFPDTKESYEFLESVIFNFGNKIVVKHHNKNIKHILKFSQQKIIKGAHINSSIMRSTCEGTIVGTFHRIKPGIGNSTDELAMLTSLEYIYELLYAQRWRYKWILAAIHRMIHSSNPRISSFFSQLIYKLRQLKVSESNLVLLHQYIIKNNEKFLKEFEDITATLSDIL